MKRKLNKKWWNFKINNNLYVIIVGNIIRECDSASTIVYVLYIELNVVCVYKKRKNSDHLETAKPVPLGDLTLCTYALHEHLNYLNPIVDDDVEEHNCIIRIIHYMHSLCSVRAIVVLLVYIYFIYNRI